MRLNRRVASAIAQGSPAVAVGNLAGLPERVLQFGEGNFLRAFVDWMVNAMNARGLFGGRAVVIQPIERGQIEALNDQDGLYTCILRGRERGRLVERREIITSISRGIDPYRHWNDFLETAAMRTLRFVVSNTTEAGIAYVEEPRPQGSCPRSFPAKVTIWLAERFRRLGDTPEAGLIFLPCELIDRNGETLRAHVLQHATSWGLPAEFERWVREHNRFLNTLVDRIVPGYPHEEALSLGTQLGYEDRLLTTGEIFHLWVIEGDSRVAEELPLTRAGLEVTWTNDLAPYRTRKVAILNGAHTMSALAAFLAGLETVRECVEDPEFGALMRRAIFDEILPLLPQPEEETRSFAERVVERLANPSIKHQLLSIALNSVAKYRVRVLPSLLQYRATRGQPPPALTFSLAALLAFYRGTEIREGALCGSRVSGPYPARDDREVLVAFTDVWRAFDTHGNADVLCRTILARTDFWGEDLSGMPDLLERVTAHMTQIVREGIRPALRALG
jgi:tagaturonate reductase